METTTHTLPGRRAAAEKRVARRVSLKSFENLRRVLRVLDFVWFTVLGIVVVRWLADRLPPAEGPVTVIVAGAFIGLGLITFITCFEAPKEALTLFVVLADASCEFNSGNHRWFPHRETLVERREQERKIVAKASYVLDTVAKITAPDALATWVRLSNLDIAVENLAQAGKQMHSLCLTPHLSPEVRVYALDALAAYESTLTPAAISDAVRRFTAAFHESTLTPWRRLHEPVDSSQLGFLEMYLRVQCRSNLDWAILNEYYLAGSKIMDARTSFSDAGPSTQTEQEFFLAWWNAPLERRIESLPFDTVLLYVPYCIARAYGWSLEKETKDYPVSIAPRMPIISPEAPIEYVTRLWSVAYATQNGSYKTLERAVSAARRITK